MTQKKHKNHIIGLYSLLVITPETKPGRTRPANQNEFDTPGVVGHSAKLGCGYCRIVGEYVVDRVCFLHCRTDPRIDECYGDFTENNQIALSPLIGTAKLLAEFPPEYMHSVCLGVVKRMCTLFFKC